MARDAVDELLAQWREQRPDLDVAPMGVLGRLSRAARLVDRRLQVNFAAFDVQSWEFDVLATLRRAGPPHRLTAGQLVASTKVTSGATTNRIDRMVARGLVTRDVDPANRRSVLIALTEAGLRLVDEAVVAHLVQEELLLASLTEAQRDQLAGLLRRVLLGLGDGLPGDS